MGLPAKWHIARNWVFSKSSVHRPKDVCSISKVKQSNFSGIENFNISPGSNFWEKFPKADLPKKPESKVSASNLKFMISKFCDNWPKNKLRRAWLLYEDLEYGGSAYQKENLPPATLPNARSAYENGELLTEKIAEFIEKGFVKGPFFEKPFEDLRSNTLMAVERGGKIRPVINMSGPDGFSFNSNIDKLKLEKVRMASAKAFGYKVRAEGKGALMSKFDLKDAFKLIPARPADYRLQGFSWLGAYFIETQMIFGAVPSVSNFDRLANTVVELTRTVSDMKGFPVCRTLDDIPFVSSKDSGLTEKFSENLEKVCSFLGVPLAEECPLKEKAFKNSTKGIVLGIGFDTQNMTWFLPNSKADKLTKALCDACCNDYMDLKGVQKLMGQLVDFSQMCPFAKCFTYTGYRFLASFEGNAEILKRPDESVRKDWAVCNRIVQSARKGLPLCKEPAGPSLESLVFYPDAAGCKFDMVQGERKNRNIVGDSGVACLLSKDKEVKWFCQVSWPMDFLEKEKDDLGKFFGSKTTTLETIGILLPFLTIPEQLIGKNVVFHTDNIGVVYGWSSKGVKKDSTASMLIRALFLMSAYLGCTVHIFHVPRKSVLEAEIADSLSRKSSTTDSVKELVSRAERSSLKGVMMDWLLSSDKKWDLPWLLLKELEDKLPYL